MYDMKRIRVEEGCPACYGKDGFLLYRVDSATSAQHFVLKESDPERHEALSRCIERLWGGAQCEVIRCSDCSFCYARPYVAGDKMFYSLAYLRLRYPRRKWEFGVTRRFLVERFLKQELQEKRLLEVGAGDGQFLRMLAPEHIRKENLLATEFSEYGLDAISSLGIRCLDQDIRSSDWPVWTGVFDIICLFQVLEHMDGLDQLFHRITALSSPGALLFISVPNERQIDFNELHRALLDMPPNHIGRWNLHCFGRIGLRHGWKVLEHRYEEEGMFRQIRRFLIYRYLRDAQRGGTLANRVRRMNPAGPRRLLEVFLVSLRAPCEYSSIAAMHALRLGDSQWICMQKVGD